MTKLRSRGLEVFGRDDLVGCWREEVGARSIGSEKLEIGLGSAKTCIRRFCRCRSIRLHALLATSVILGTIKMIY